MLRIAKLGLSNFLNQIIMMTVGITLNNILTHYGTASVYGADIPLAVAGIVTKLNSVLIAFTVGLAQGCQPIFSFNMGAENYGRIKETLSQGTCFCAAFKHGNLSGLSALSTPNHRHLRRRVGALF